MARLTLRNAGWGFLGNSRSRLTSALSQSECSVQKPSRESFNTINMKINYRKKVPCFGNEPASDIRLMQKITAAQVERERLKHAATAFTIYTGSAVIAGMLLHKIAQLFRN
jgi:hypothetical protein